MAGHAVTRYAVRHRTEYRYGAPVTSSHTLAHLLPRSTSHQSVVSASVVSEPPADHSHTYLDAFGNLATFIGVEQPHDRLVVFGVSELDVDGPAWPSEGAGIAWDEVGARLATDTSTEGLLARACSVASPLVGPTPDLAAYAAPSFPRGRRLDEALRDLSTRIHADFAFDATFSDVSTPLAEVLEARRGVCQDFAHLAIGCLRALGLAARYVSGYLETQPPPGLPRLTGADASHAWCSAFAPGAGWLDLDPTNDQVPPHRHVTVAWGRDYADVAPVRGVVFGPATDQELLVEVDVVTRDGTGAP